MSNGYTLGLIVETLVSHPGFRYTFIQRFGRTNMKPKNSQIEEYLSTKCMIALTASLFLEILMPFGSSISKSPAG